MNAGEDEVADIPPMAPDGDETRGVENSEFAELCRKTGLEHAARSEGELGPPLLTWSETWGFVWRADFTMRGQSRDDVNRLVIWGRDTKRTQAAVAIGLAMPPLHGAHDDAP